MQGCSDARSAGRIKTPSILLTAASIVTVEARHAGAVAELLGKSISPSGAYDAGKSMKDVLAAVKATKLIKAKRRPRAAVLPQGCPATSGQDG